MAQQYCDYKLRVNIDNCRIRVERREDNAGAALLQETFEAPLWETSIKFEPNVWGTNEVEISFHYHDQSETLNYNPSTHLVTTTTEFYVAGADTAYVDFDDLLTQLRAQQAACAPAV